MPAVQSQFSQEERADFVLAARYGDLDDVIAFLDHGMNVLVLDTNGNTALHMAAANGHAGACVDSEGTKRKLDLDLKIY